MVSVIIPCYNQSQYLRMAVDGVLVQTRGDLEVIIVNDASEDETLDVANDIVRENPGRIIRIIDKPVRDGLSNARNTGIYSASGEYILPLDADDFLAPTFIAETGAMLDVFRDVDIAYTDRFNFGARCQLVQLFPLDEAILPIYNQLGYCALYRKKCWSSVGGYRKNFPVMGYEDWEFWIDCAEMGFGFRHIPKTLWFYRVRESGMAFGTYAKREQLLARIVSRHPNLYLPETVERARKELNARMAE